MNETVDILKESLPLTSLSSRSMKNIVDIIEYCICNNIANKCNREEDVIHCDIGIGMLHIQWDKESLRMNFSPSGVFESYIKNAINGEDELVKALESSLVSKVTRIYKELL